MKERLSVIFHGNVQGVGFRFNTKQIASGFDVVGTVRNCSNGTVEMVGEGERKELLGLVGAIREHFSNHIENAILDWSAATGEFEAFQIRM
jgi:acylphosphatase